MIALDRELPSNCAECPCYQTLHLYNEETMIQDTLVRRCAAKGKVIKAVKWKEGDPALEDAWYDFTKPVWCPWISIDGGA